MKTDIDQVLRHAPAYFSLIARTLVHHPLTSSSPAGTDRWTWDLLSGGMDTAAPAPFSRSFYLPAKA